MNKKIIIWGSGGHAKVILDAIHEGSQYVPFGFIDDIYPERQDTFLHNVRILGGREHLDVCRQQGVAYCIVGIGNCQVRSDLANYAEKKGFNLATIIHPKSIISQYVTLGQGTAVLAGAVINTDTIIGNNVIVNTSSSIDHDCTIGNGVHICPGVHIAGHVVIGENTWLGIGSTISNNVTIGKNVMLGAGSVVVKDIPDNVVAYGVPAKIHKFL